MRSLTAAVGIAVFSSFSLMGCSQLLTLLGLGNDTANSVIPHHVYYDGNGNTGGTAPVDSNTYINGGTVQVQPGGSLVKTGYAFQTWNTQSDGLGVDHGPSSHLTMGTADIYLYAKWQSTFSITYDDDREFLSANLPTGSVPVDTTLYTSSQTVTVLPKGNLARAGGHTFLGWNTADDGSGTSYQPNDTFSMTHNTTLYAQWSIVKTTVADAEDTSETGGSGSTTQWQDFTAQNSGTLDQVMFNYADPLFTGAVAQVTVTVTNNSGGTGATLGTQTVPAIPNNNGSWYTFDFFSQGITLTAGNHYSLILSTPTVIVAWVNIDTSNSYSGGQSSLSSDWDLIFQVLVTTSYEY